LLLVSVVVLSSAELRADTFGKVVPIRGAVSDIALDEMRGRLYIANFSAGQIDVMDTSDQTVETLLVTRSPISSIALSPDKRYLVVGHYKNFPDLPANPTPGGLAIYDLDRQTWWPVHLDSPVLSVAFGKGSKCLVVTSTAALLIDPASAETENLRPSHGVIDPPVP
jgi:hypothetical protein